MAGMVCCYVAICKYACKHTRTCVLPNRWPAWCADMWQSASTHASIRTLHQSNRQGWFLMQTEQVIAYKARRYLVREASQVQTHRTATNSQTRAQAPQMLSTWAEETF
eukprot:1161736-Pelagomonas_calceolata.AAC.6